VLGSLTGGPLKVIRGGSSVGNRLELCIAGPGTARGRNHCYRRTEWIRVADFNGGAARTSIFVESGYVECAGADVHQIGCCRAGAPGEAICLACAPRSMRAKVAVVCAMAANRHTVMTTDVADRHGDRWRVSQCEG